MCHVYFLFFFFSSRRRHTRWPRDWSSDVCSSDLLTVERGVGEVRLEERGGDPGRQPHAVQGQRRLVGEPQPRQVDQPGGRLQAQVLRSVRVAALVEREGRSEEHTSELQSRGQLVCRLLLEKKKR